MGGGEQKDGVDRDSGCSRDETGVVDSLPLPCELEEDEEEEDERGDRCDVGDSSPVDAYDGRTSEVDGEKVDVDDVEVIVVNAADSGTGNEANGEAAGNEQAAIDALILPEDDEDDDEERLAAEEAGWLTAVDAVWTPGLY